MLVIRCIHCEHYNSEHCKKCLASIIPYTAYKERTEKVISDISYEAIEKKKANTEKFEEEVA